MPTTINFDRVLSNGKCLEGEVAGLQWRARNVKATTLFPALKDVPTDTLEKRTKDHLKKAGFAKVHATRREHPFHDPSFRARVDECVNIYQGVNPLYCIEAYCEAERKQRHEDADKMAFFYQERGQPFDVEAEKKQADDQVVKLRHRAERAWAKEVNTYRGMLRDPSYWGGTKRYHIMTYQAEFEPPPPAVYVCDQNPGIVLLLKDNGSFDVYSRISDPPAPPPKRTFDCWHKRKAYLDAPIPQPQLHAYLN